MDTLAELAMAVERLPVKQEQKQKQKQVVVHKKDPRIQYHSTGYRDINHARGCCHVKRAITHHNISDKEMFFSILASGLSIVAALVTVGIAL